MIIRYSTNYTTTIFFILFFQ
eukprot:SAG22_NODE_9511_length_585_cov_24.450617_1_plen_20_part_10